MCKKAGRPGDTLTLEEAEKECAVLLACSGQVTLCRRPTASNETCSAKNPFEKKKPLTPCTFAGALQATVTAIEGSQVLVQMTDNVRTRAPEILPPGATCLYQEFGQGVSGNGTGPPGSSLTMLRLIWDKRPSIQTCDGRGVQSSRGAWSLIRPTTTPSRRCNYYQFDHPEASAPGLRGDNPYKTQNGDCLLHSEAATRHQQVTGSRVRNVIMYG